MKSLVITFCFLALSCRAAFFQPWTDNGELIIANHVAVGQCTNLISIAIWTTKLPTTLNAGGIITKGGAGSPGLFDIQDGGGPMRFQNRTFNGAIQSWISTTTFSNANALTFWAVTFDYLNTNSFKLYSNGVLKSGSWELNPANQLGSNQFNAIHIGARFDGRRWLGYYSELGIWNSVLTSDQVKLLYSARVKGLMKQINPDTLRAYYPLNDMPDGIEHNARTAYPDRKAGGNNAGPVAITTHNASGMAERVLSYPPNQ